MAQCRRCGADFVPTPGAVRNHDWICRPCAREEWRAGRAKRKAEGRLKPSSKTWDPDKRSRWLQAYFARPDVRRRNADRMARYRQDPRLAPRHEARAAVRTALRRGVLVAEPCEVCGGIAQAHHDDYDRPLDVRWLCRPHHDAHHAKATGSDQ